MLAKAFAENDCFNRPFLFLSILSKYGRRLFIIKSRHYSIRHSTLYSITGDFWIMTLVFFCYFISTFPDMANSWLTLQVLVESWSSGPSAWVFPGKKLERGRIAGQYKRWGSCLSGCPGCRCQTSPHLRWQATLMHQGLWGLCKYLIRNGTSPHPKDPQWFFKAH